LLYSNEDLKNVLHKELNPVHIEFCNINNENKLTEAKKCMIIPSEDLIHQTNFYKMEWSKYSKLPTRRDSLYSLEEINDLTPETKLERKINFGLNDVLYIEIILIKKVYDNMLKHNKHYDFTFILRTDVIWFESWNLKNKLIERPIQINNLELPSLSYKEIFNNINNYNVNILPKCSFDKFLNNINTNKNTCLSSMYYIEDYNFYMPCQHAMVLTNEDLHNLIKFRTNLKDYILFQSKYPILYPSWDGEYTQKLSLTATNINVNSNFFLNMYSVILRL